MPAHHLLRQLARVSEPGRHFVEAPPAPSAKTIGAHELAATSVGLGAVTVWLGLLGLITTPILIHHLGATRYGVFALITIMSAYLLNLELGFGHATVRFLARARAAGDSREAEHVLGTALAVFVAGGLVALVIALGSSSWIGNTFFHGPKALRGE